MEEEFKEVEPEERKKKVRPNTFPIFPLVSFISIQATVPRPTYYAQSFLPFPSTVSRFPASQEQDTNKTNAREEKNKLK